MSLLAALGVSKEDRNHLGRWSPSGSEEYVRTYRAMMKKLVSTFLSAVAGGNGYQDLEEAEAIDGIRGRLKMREVNEDSMELICRNLKVIAKEMFGKLEEANAGNKAKENVSVYADRAIRVDECDASDDDLAKGGGETAAGFVVAYDLRRKTSCLHRRDGCYRGRRLLFSAYEVFAEADVAKNTCTNFCGACWPKTDAEAEDSDSGELDIDDVEALD